MSAAAPVSIHADRGAGSGRDRQPLFLQGVVHVAEQGPGAHGRNAGFDRDGVHRADVDDEPGARGPSGEAVASAARGELEAVAPGERDRLGHVDGRRAPDDGARPDVTEPGVERLRQLLIRGRPGEHEVARDRTFEVRPIGTGAGRVVAA